MAKKKSNAKGNKKLARRFYKGLNAGDLGVIDEFFSDDLVEHEEFAGSEPAKVGVRHQFEWLQAAFPDGRFEVEDMIAEGDKVFVRADDRHPSRGVHGAARNRPDHRRRRRRLHAIREGQGGRALA